jgi:hypothetical protein
MSRNLLVLWLGREGTLGTGEPLHLHPSAAGLQHCEVLSADYRVRSALPWYLKGFATWFGWPVKLREIHDDASIHRTVLERMALERVTQAGAVGAYRPRSLGTHRKCRGCYRRQQNY